MKNKRMEYALRKALLVAVGLSSLFTVALFFVMLEALRVINVVLVNAFPDWGLTFDLEKMREVAEFLRPVGYVGFVAVLVLIIAGFMVRKGYLSTIGSVGLYLPTFGYFAFTMFFLAGVGVLRALWFPLLDLSPNVLQLGNIVYVPYFLLAFLFVLIDVDVSALLASTMMGAGILAFFLGTVTWLYGKFKSSENHRFLDL